MEEFPSISRRRRSKKHFGKLVVEILLKKEKERKKEKKKEKEKKRVNTNRVVRAVFKKDEVE